MSKIVFILGAGASVHAGAPVMIDFLDKAKDLYARGIFNDFKQDFENVFNAIGQLQKVHSKSQLDIINIESVFNAFEMGKLIGCFPCYKEEDINNLIESLKLLIVKTLEETVQFPTQGQYIKGTNVYNNFATVLSEPSRGMQKHNYSIITFNYDLALDVSLYENNIRINYFLPGYEANDIPLLKLHGSLNWTTKKTSNDIIPLFMKDYFKRYSIQHHFPGERTTAKLPLSIHLREYFFNSLIEVSGNPVIIPPAWNKTDYHSGISSVWKKAAKELSDCEYLYILGYSLPETDYFFRLLYSLGTVGERPFREIIVYNPDTSGQVEGRFNSLIGSAAKSRFSYKPLDFKTAIEDLNNRVSKIA